ncbi:MICOS complex subunit MIC60 [Novosphingobium sp. 1949]|uniref:MICOS complex subunit MIC60 n=1 Tax=Novosphingobium organovorum TaxID=2930092 RepID=A0ABT0BIV7_9SPHN|nr:MICOS complex subunit MIC60 [Novosphingobium organovorum]MCJ2184875.1 MICOS complex subunit MIC60 [Novosphingobium organovorum]
MQDFETQPLSNASAADAAYRARARSTGAIIFIAIIAFLLGAMAVAWASSRGLLDRYLPVPEASETPALEDSAPVNAETLVDPANTALAPPAPAAGKPTPEQLAALGSVEGRLALIEDRLSRIDFQTDAASGNAARAESLLIAFAARRMVERGEPLSYVADQLRLRFMDAQPHAVETIIGFSKDPVTIDELTARLEALSPELTVSGNTVSFWDRARNELSSLFTVHRDAAALVSPRARIERARIMLTARRIDAAIDEVQRLPGADAAHNWVADARRFEDVQKALNLLETTAMLDPRRLKDGEGRAVDQPSPLASPTDLTPSDEASGGASGGASAPPVEGRE